MEEREFIIWNSKKGLNSSPRIHETLEDASNEAERIAELEPNTEIKVLQVVTGITYPSKKFIYRNFRR